MAAGDQPAMGFFALIRFVAPEVVAQVAAQLSALWPRKQIQPCGERLLAMKCLSVVRATLQLTLPWSTFTG